MTKDQAIEYYGGTEAGGASRLADALGIERQAVYQWTTVPPLRQLQLQNLTNGALMADPEISKTAAA